MKNSGFTLIELLIVMVIIGILTTIIGGNFVSSREKARDAQRKSDLSQIAKALELYQNDHNTYPDSSLVGEIVGCGEDGAVAVCAWGDPFVFGNDPANLNDDALYMSELPTDFRDTHHYYYWSNGTSYQLYAQLKNERDGSLETDSATGDVLYYSNTQCEGTTNGTCNYGISSTNTTPEANRTLN